jgi:hypothetical protein
MVFCYTPAGAYPNILSILFNSYNSMQLTNSMHLTKQSQILISHYVKDPLSSLASPKPRLLSQIHRQLEESDSFIRTASIQRRIERNHVLRPKTFDMQSFPASILPQMGRQVIQYEFGSTKIHFILNKITDLSKYDQYAHWMFVWLHMIAKSNSCVKKLDVYVYHTAATKELPTNGPMGQQHVNTAFTRCCGSEIVLFRKEEWFKVFLHETFHTFSLDFSEMNTTACNNRMLRLFPVKSRVNLEESYSECWARIINAVFCGYFYGLPSHRFIGIEQMHAAFQVNKILGHMGLNYADLTKATANKKYKEDTSVLAYYVITFILLQHVDEWLDWCALHNINNNNKIFSFTKSTRNLNDYCAFIECCHNSQRVQQAMRWADKRMREKSSAFLRNNLRMAANELSL